MQTKKFCLRKLSWKITINFYYQLIKIMIWFSQDQTI